MSLINVIEQSIKNLNSLPAAVQRNMTEIRRLDAVCQKLNVEVQSRVRSLIGSWKSITKDQRKKSYESLRTDFQRMRELCDEKIRISEQTYELVDKYIIKLDNDTAKLNAAVRKKFSDVSSVTAGNTDFQNNVNGRRKRKNTATKKDGKRMKKTERLDSINVKVAEPFPNSTAPLVDMPVDPNEPTYCTCHQVSFGQMVMCDNKNCLIEWFHFQCVGLNTKPRGKWYCENCSEQRRKKT